MESKRELHWKVQVSIFRVSAVTALARHGDVTEHSALLWCHGPFNMCYLTGKEG